MNQENRAEREREERLMWNGRTVRVVYGKESALIQLRRGLEGSR